MARRKERIRNGTGIVVGTGMDTARRTGSVAGAAAGRGNAAKVQIGTARVKTRVREAGAMREGAVMRGTTSAGVTAERDPEGDSKEACLRVHSENH